LFSLIRNLPCPRSVVNALTTLETDVSLGILQGLIAHGVSLATSPRREVQEATRIPTLRSTGSQISKQTSTGNPAYSPP